MKHLLTFAALLATSLAFGQDECCALMDYDGDRNVSISDFTIFLSNYGSDQVPGYTDCIPCYTSVVFDADEQGEIGLSDLLIMLSLFGAADVDFDLIWDSVDQCFDTNACNFMDALADGCIYPDIFGICGGQCLADNDQDGICDDEDGCSDSNACNFMNPASIECVYQDALGICGGPCELDIDGDLRCDDIDNCTDIEACNYLNPSACACSYGDAGGGCIDPGDIDGDGVCDSQDACFDLEACNYAAYPTSPCAYDLDSDGVCDNQDDCIGVYDECGVCNGPGPTELVVENITIVYDSIYLSEIEGWEVYEIGADTTFGYACGPLFSCADPVSYQGYDYATVLIGDQCWFAENLRSEYYENGDAIPSGLNDSQWNNTSSGAAAVFGEGNSYCVDSSPDGDACDEAWSLNEYGRLYNWYAVDDVRGLCPSGWHIPTDVEWMTMEMALGLSEDEANSAGGRGTHGTKMKTDYGWNSLSVGTNSSGFSALPSGVRASNGFFVLAGTDGLWWSSTSIGSEAWGRLLNTGWSVERAPIGLLNGFSVRCIQDSE